MGYRGAVYVLQEIVNRLYDTLFHFLPVDGAYARTRSGSGGASANGGPPSAGQTPGNLPWTDEAKAALDEALAKLPFLSRISASRELQMKAELLARESEAAEVTVDLVTQMLAAGPN
jgi:chlorophyllide a reductase subunit Z